MTKGEIRRANRYNAQIAIFDPYSRTDLGDIIQETRDTISDPIPIYGILFETPVLFLTSNRTEPFFRTLGALTHILNRYGYERGIHYSFLTEENQTQ